MIVASMNSIPSRKETFKQTVRSILREQSCPVDRLHVYLYQYQHIHSDLPQDSRLEYHLEYPNAGPWARYIIADSLDDDDVLITIDDDTLYPSDYVATGLRELNHFGKGTTVCFSGICWDPFADHYTYTEDRWQSVSATAFARHRIAAQQMGQTSFYWAKSVKKAINIAVPGFNTNDDMMMCYALQQRNIRVWCCPKSANWIQDLNTFNAPDALTQRDAQPRRQAFHDMVYKLGFDPSAGILKEFLAKPRRILVLADVCPPLAGSERLDESLRQLCAGDVSVHLLAIVPQSQAGPVQQYATTPYEIHAVSVPEPGGRLDYLAPVKAWRDWRVARGHRIKWNRRWKLAIERLQPTQVFVFRNGWLEAGA
jgi:hypothetical protein